MKHKQRFACLVMAGLLGAFTMVPARGATTGPGTTTDPYRGYGEEKWNQLSDNVIEYGELADLVWEFNPSIVAGDAAVKGGIELTRMMAQGFYNDSKSYKDLAEQLKNAGMMGEYAAMMGASNQMKKQGESLNRTATYSERVTSSSYKSIRRAQKMITNGAEQIMIGYNSAASQRATVAKMKDLYAATYDATVLQQALGMATQTDVIGAQTNLLSADNTLTKLDNSMDSLKRSLCMMAGMSADAQPEIRPLPTLDVERVPGIDLEQDTVKAIGNNYTLIDQRNTKTNSTATTDNKLRLNEEGEQKLRIEMQSLHQNILQKKAAYESAGTAFESASLAKAAADRQYQLGMTSKLQYMGQQLGYLQAEGGLGSAELDLIMALQTYDQAIDGFLAIE